MNLKRLTRRNFLEWSLGAALLARGLAAGGAAAPPAMQWPPVQTQMRPWTRWWWLGSAVDKDDLTRLLEEYHRAGLGGVEITPIYGVQGEQAREIAYLSSQWVEMLRHTITEAHRRGMGVDMPTGTGWPFGGPQVTDADALDRLAIQRTPLAAGAAFTWPPGAARPEALTAVSDTGQTVQVLDRLGADGHLNWTPPAGSWTLYAVSIRWGGLKVKRAAPGGEGYCINPFSRKSLTDYLARFDTALAGLPPGALRCHFHDSFEYRANWAPTLLDEFQNRRGYDLRDHVAALNGDGDPDQAARVQTDYRETVGDMLQADFIQPWTDWAHARGSRSRYQAHGSPGNLLDLYGTADIPETEAFNGTGDPRTLKFASSAAHVLGRPLASSETCTWLSEHFTVTLPEAKFLVDRMLTAGINHIFYHGTAYSPADAAWPGWLFYASTDFKPTDPIWHDFPVLNAYITRCQSLLQSGTPDNDVLLYWPLHDLWMDDPSAFTLDISGRWLLSQPVGATAQTLWGRGLGYDFVSDRQLAEARAAGGGVQMPGGHYRAVVVPPCAFMPEATLASLLRLADAGVPVIFQGGLPRDVPGLADLPARRQRFRALLDGAAPTKHLVIGGDVEASLASVGVRREAVTDHPGLVQIRRKDASGYVYLLANQGTAALDGWTELAVPFRSAVLMDPMTGRLGAARVRRGPAGRPQVRLQLAPAESVIVRALAARQAPAPAWDYAQPAGPPIPVAGPWDVRFLSGGPALPPPFRAATLASWTAQGGPDAERFAGTARYTATFDAPAINVDDAPPMPPDEWWLDLGQVRETARVRLNGRDVGALITGTNRVRLGPIQPTGNVLEVDVTNVAANRVRDLDRRGVRWKVFDEINFVGRDYQPFDASGWPVRDSGLLGPVTLLPMRASAQ